MSKGRKKTTKSKGLGVGAFLSGIVQNHDIEDPKDAKNSLSESPNQAIINELAAKVVDIPIQLIQPTEEQPRKHFDQEALEELAESIESYGLIQPITVRHIRENREDKFQIISGERRYRACKIAGLTEIPAYVRLVNDQEMMEMALVENIQREDLNAMEIAETYQRLIDEFDLKLEDLADRVGKGRSTVNNYTRLLKLPEKIRKAVKANQISMGHARALLAVDVPADCLAIFQQILDNNLSVRQTEALTRDYKLDKTDTKKPQKDKPKLPFDFQKVQDDLKNTLDTKVELKRNNETKKGKIIIHFTSDKDLNRILDILEEGEA